MCMYSVLFLATAALHTCGKERKRSLFIVCACHALPGHALLQPAHTASQLPPVYSLEPCLQQPCLYFCTQPSCHLWPKSSNSLEKGQPSCAGMPLAFDLSGSFRHGLPNSGLWCSWPRKGTCTYDTVPSFPLPPSAASLRMQATQPSCGSMHGLKSCAASCRSSVWSLILQASAAAACTARAYVHARRRWLASPGPAAAKAHQQAHARRNSLVGLLIVLRAWRRSERRGGGAQDCYCWVLGFVTIQPCCATTAFLCHLHQVGHIHLLFLPAHYHTHHSSLQASPPPHMPPLPATYLWFPTRCSTVCCHHHFRATTCGTPTVCTVLLLATTQNRTCFHHLPPVTSTTQTWAATATTQGSLLPPHHSPLPVGCWNSCHTHHSLPPTTTSSSFPCTFLAATHHTHPNLPPIHLPPAHYYHPHLLLPHFHCVWVCSGFLRLPGPHLHAPLHARQRCLQTFCWQRPFVLRGFYAFSTCSYTPFYHLPAFPAVPPYAFLLPATCCRAMLCAAHCRSPFLLRRSSPDGTTTCSAFLTPLPAIYAPAAFCKLTRFCTVCTISFLSSAFSWRVSAYHFLSTVSVLLVSPSLVLRCTHALHAAPFSSALYHHHHRLDARTCTVRSPLLPFH